MIVAGSASPLLLASAAGGYNLTNSLRFRRSAGAYLNRTPSSAGNRKTWTFSAWVKLGAITGGSYFLPLLCADDGTQTTLIGFGQSPITYPNSLYFVNGGSNIITTAVYRDPSSWYHIVVAVDTTQATASNRVKLYVNGSEITSFVSAAYPSQNADLAINSANSHTIADQGVGTGRFFDGYLAEYNLVNGQALTPSSFGQTDSKTGVWQPKKYTGTYGTNGFYLPFTNNSTTTTLGNDFSGNGNNWTTNNISLTAGATYDSMTDVPTLTSATQANFATLNPIAQGTQVTLSNANLTYSVAGMGTSTATFSTIGMTSGKWYCEFIAGGNDVMVGLSQTTNGAIGYIGVNSTSWGYYGNTGQKYNNNTASSYGATYTTNDIVGIAFDADNGTLTFYKNNVSQGTAYTGLTSGPYFFAIGNGGGANSGASVNFGQRPFAYTPPTGFVALNTFNLPTPTIGATASTQADNYFDAKTYTGTGATQTITVDFASDFAWLKRRDGAGENVLLDRLRLTGSLPNRLFSNSTAAESTTADGQNSFSSSGIVLDGSGGGGGEVNTSGRTYVAWQWKANGTGVTNTAGSITSTVSVNTSSGFSIVTYTGTGANATVGHGLGVAPAMIIVKRRNGITSWFVYTQATGNGNALLLNDTAASTATNAWNSTSPTSSVFSLGSNNNVNASGGTNVAYCFAEVAGFSRFSSYTGNGSSDGTFVFTGFRPRYVMVKRTDSTGNWVLNDTARSPFNLTDDNLFPNESAAEEGTFGAGFDFLSNGFKLRNSGTDTNGNGSTYIYMAFAENPFKYSLAR